MKDLGDLGGGYSEGYGINDMGQVVGKSGTRAGATEHAFLYSDGVMQDLGTLGERMSIACGINNSGQITGASATVDGLVHAFLYSNGAMTDLNTLVDQGSGWTLLMGNAINDSGQIVGYGTNPAGREEAFLLTPIPEPATLLLLGLGGMLLRSRKF